MHSDRGEIDRDAAPAQIEMDAPVFFVAGRHKRELEVPPFRDELHGRVQAETLPWFMRLSETDRERAWLVSFGSKSNLIHTVCLNGNVRLVKLNIEAGLSCGPLNDNPH